MLPGVIETIASVIALQESFCPAHRAWNTIAEGLPASLVKEPRAAAHLQHILKLNTGFGGVNGAFYLEP